MVSPVFLLIGIVENNEKEKNQSDEGHNKIGSIMIPYHVAWMHLFWQPQA